MTGDPPSAPPRVRRFASRDLEQVLKIARQSPEAAAWSDESYLRFDRDGQFAWVVERCGNVFGFLVARTVAADEAEILNLAVVPFCRRAGNATALLQSCMGEFTGGNILRVFLEVRESNLPAIAFYESQKFVRTGRRPDYYRNPSEAAVLLVRKLTA
jgi:ribosomal-protein-alanine N-acetyltransferase